MTKSVFITGVSGFIGFHLARYLHENGDNVVGMDNFNNYYDPQLKRDRAAELTKMGVRVIEGDITLLPLFQKAVEEHGTTHLVHLAAQAGVRYSIENPQAYVNSNLSGFANVLEVCRNLPGTRLVYASSSSVYGLNDTIPFSETDVTDRPASFYGATKKCNELMAHSYHHLYGIPMTGLRFFTVYGPWGRPDMAYYSFTNSILQGKPIKVFNNGNMERDFTYIDDIVEGIDAALDAPHHWGIYNLGNNHPEQLVELIDLVESALGIRAEREYLPMQPGDVHRTYANIDRAAADLGFKPKTSLEEGIGKFVAWYREYNAASAKQSDCTQKAAVER